MVESFFGLAKRPFCVAPNPDTYVPTPCCQQAIDQSIRSVVRSEGPSLIIGAAGMGKTICAMKIAQWLSHSMQVALLTSSQACTRRALLQSILYHLGLDHSETSEGALRLQLQERLTHPTEKPTNVALVIDEAQTLSVKLLDEIRILSNSLHKGKPTVHLILVGTLKLEDTLAHPHMESLNQRIVSRHYLNPLSFQETLQYINQKIEIAGGQPTTVFESPAIDAIYRASNGIPRLIEQLADQAILQSGSQHERPISANRIAAVWNQVHQLPTPWQESPKTIALGTHHQPIHTGESQEPTQHFETQPIKAQTETVTPTAKKTEFQQPKTDQLVSLGTSQVAAIEFGSLDDDSPDSDSPESESSDSESPDDESTRMESCTENPCSHDSLSDNINLFQPFLEEPVEIHLAPSARVARKRTVSTDILDESFGQLIQELNLAAIQLQPGDHAFVRAELSTKSLPKPATSGFRNALATACELVGISVNGDDRDMIVVIEEQDWVNPFAIR